MSHVNGKGSTSNGVNGNHVSAANASEKREDYLSWDEYFMATAFLSAMRSKDPVTQVGLRPRNPFLI